MSESAIRSALVNLSPRQLRIVLPAVSKTERAANLLPGHTSVPDSVEPEDAPAVVQRIWARYEQVGFERLELRDLRMLAETLWVTPNPFLVDTKIFTALGSQLRARKTRRILYALLTSYIAGFDENSQHTTAIAKFLAEEAKDYGFSWLSAASELNLFDSHNAPRTIADQAMASSEDPTNFLFRKGLPVFQSGNGLPLSAFRAAAKKVKATSQNREQQTLKLLEWAQTPQGDERFPTVAEALADALLSPWPLSPPPGDLGAQIVKFLIRHYKDPRMYPANWDARIDHSRPHDKKLQAIFRRWQTGRSIERFLSVVGRYANREQWKYRKSFWMSYFSRGYITDAWVVLGQNPRAVLKTDDLAEVGLLGPGRLADHSVLVMKIGDLTIADWSHNAKCHMWRKNDRGAPRLFMKHYPVESLSSGTWSESHTASDHGNWQRKFSDHIYKQTNVRLTERDWMPDR